MEVLDQFQQKWEQTVGKKKPSQKKPSVWEQPENPKSTQVVTACFSALLMDCILLKIWITE